MKLIIRIVITLGVVLGSGTVAAPATAAASAPSVTNVTPNVGTDAHRPLVAVSGAGFTGASVVTFSGVRASEVRVLSSTLLYARPPSPPARYTAHVQVRTGAGLSPANVHDHYTTGNAPREPSRIRSLGLGRPIKVSCPTAEFCMVLGDHGQSVAVRGATPGPLQTVPLPATAISLSCASADFCAAVSAHGQTVWDGTAWHAATSQFDTGIFQGDLLSCSADHSCVAIGNYGVWWRYDGTTWTSHRDGPRVYPQGDPSFWAVSCVSTTFCVAAGDWNHPTDDTGEFFTTFGRTYRFDGESWTLQYASRSDTTGEFDPRVSCSSAVYCLALTDRAESYDGTRWTPGPEPAADLRGSTLRCFGPDRCVANAFASVSGAGAGQIFGWELRRLTDGRWTTVGELSTSRTQVFDCGSARVCTAVGADATVRRADAAAQWSDPMPLEDVLVNPTIVSCVGHIDDAWCLTADAAGNVATWDGHTWSAPVLVDAAGSPTSGSCPAVAACVLVDDRGNVLRFDDGTWTEPEPVDTVQLNQVSCASATLCVAVDEGGSVVRYEDGRWHSPTQRNGGAALRGVSCTSATFCMAVGAGNAVRYLGSGRWTAVTDLGAYASSVSCSSSSYCLIRAGDATLRFWGGEVFSPPYVFGTRDGNTLNTMSCARHVAPEYCVLVTHFEYEGEPNSAVRAFYGAAGAAILSDARAWTAVSCWAAYGKCVFVGGDGVSVQTG